MPYNADLGPTLYVPAADRYETMRYRRCGRSGLRLPAISLGPVAELRRRPAARDRRAIVRRAFDLGITHFDLANNYGPPYGSAGDQLRPRSSARISPRYRDELIISTKAGYDMWPGPYGEWGSRKYLLASLDQSLRRMRPRLRRHLLLAPLRPRHAARETMGALDAAVRAGKALYVGRSPPTAPSARARRRAILRELGTPLLIHQPSYSLLNRWIEAEAAGRARARRAWAASRSRRSRRAC